MNLNKSTFLAFIMAGSFHQAVGAGIPVVDEVSIAQTAKNWADQLKQWSETTSHYRKQISAYQDQLATQTGARDIVSFIQSAKGLHSELDGFVKSANKFNDLMKGADMPAELNSLFGRYGLFDMCKIDYNVSLCKATVVSKVATIEQTSSAMAAMSKKVSDMAVLSDRISNSKDAKESQDLANAMQAKNAEISALKTQMDMITAQNDAREKVLHEQRIAAHSQQQRNAPVPTFK
ncbi:hypothetical protein BUE93_22155 [Chromobacterium amazonense]|uniref:Type IV secretion system protein VirB5 n=1 Tax=Chromobacterium amazonense TaxID=1382803 RepID=A0A2S9WYN8_9NEIS|nr:type IV secretion system protein [Chromobacterium amazonense]PRP68506.1 hypothetical protein BUE93_22155 [Chromobacterium amazonense]